MIPTLQLGGLGRSFRRDTTPWTPGNLASPASIWVNDDSAVTDAGSGACSQWNDLSANAYHFVQSNSGRRPLIVASGLNSRRIIRFNGTSGEMVTNAAGALAIFNAASQGWVCAVVKSNVSDTTSRALVSAAGGTGTARLGMRIQSSSLAAGLGEGVFRRLDADSAGTLSNTVNTGTGAHIRMLTMLWSAGDGTSYIDGVQDAQNLSITTSGNTSGTNADRPIGLGAFPGFAGAAGAAFASADVAEVLIGTTIPTTLERQKLEGYLAHRWGLTGNLDVAHPYKSSPPTV